MLFGNTFKRFACLTAILLACLLSMAQQPFPYRVVVSTVPGVCFNNCQAVVTLYNAQGQVIQTNDSLHQPLNPTAYPIANLQYHYKNQLYNSVFYSDSHVLTMDAGTYDIGVSGQVMVQTGSGHVPVMVDTTLHGITLASSYNPFSASVLAMTAGNGYMMNGTMRDRCGNRPAAPCADRGRVQMKLMAGRFPYTVLIINAQQDTIRREVFHQRQHNGTDSLYADYKDYYTFDSLAAGTYRIVAYDACSYSLVLYHTVPLNDVRVNYLCFRNVPPNSSDSNTVRFAVQFNTPMSVCNYDYSYYESIFQYRFIHPDGSGQTDTSSWHPVVGSSLSNLYNGMYCDTLDFAGRYCDLYGSTVRFEVRDLCHLDTVSMLMTIKHPDTMCYATDVWDDGFCLGQTTLDTCSQVCDTSVHFTLMYRIWYDCGHDNYFTSSNYTNQFFYTYPLHWVYKNIATGQVIKTDPVYEITEKSILTNTDVESIYGRYSYLPLPVERSLVDAHGCVLMSRFDTLVFVRDTTPAESPYPWKIETNFNRNNYSRCFYTNRAIWVYEQASPFPMYRDSTVVRLVKSPLYNKYNFTATYAQGQWTIVKDDTLNNDANIVATGMNVSISNNRLSGGLYVFVCETVCGTDTLQVDIDGIYYNGWEWVEDPVYQSEQECNDLVVLPVAGKYRYYTYHIDSQVSNDEPIVTSYDYTPNINLVSGVVGGYSSTSTSMNVPFRFTMPGEYVIKMSVWGCDSEYFHIDTILFERVRIDFEKAYAVMCDSTVNTGTVIARAVRGTPPYTYSLYSQPDLHGSLLGTSQSGALYGVPMQIGQEMSVVVMDSCENSYYVNIVAMSLAQSQLLWFDGGTPDPGVCVGDTVTLEALPVNDFITYTWTGPGNFTATGRQITFCAAETSYRGWLSVELLNTGCPSRIRDSLYLNVLAPPQVFVSAAGVVCPGEMARVDFTALGTDTVFFNMCRSFAGTQSCLPLNVLAQDTLSLYFPIETENLFWVGQSADNYCPGSPYDDSVRVSVFPATNTIDTARISARDTLVCYGGDATLSVSSTLANPCILNWFDNTLQNVVLKQDTLHSASDISTFTIPQLLVDTTLQVAVWYQDNCPAHIGRADVWMNMRSGTTAILPGQGVRLYDSGGADNPYSNNEMLVHTFQSPSGLFRIHFHTLDLSAGDTLYVLASSSIVGSFSGTSLPADITLAGSTVTFRFVSNQSNTSSGWSLDILTPVLQTEVSVSVIRFFDTLTASVCQSEELFSYPPFSRIDISEIGVLQLDTMLSSAMGCDSAVTLKLEVLPVKGSRLDTAICEGGEFVMGDYRYSDAGTYRCNFTAENGCDSVVTLYLDVVRNKTEIIPLEEDFCKRYHTILTVPIDGDDYIWNTGDITSSLDVESPGTYMVTIHHRGCVVTARYDIDSCHWVLYLPNAITPLKPDGLNDVFCLLEEQKAWIEEFELYVFNRWSEMVYTTRDKNFRWDGSVRGRIYPNNLYNYYIRLTDKTGQKLFYQGTLITL